MIEIALLACAVCRARERLKRKSLKRCPFLYSYCFSLANRKSIYFCCIEICFLYISQFALAFSYKRLSFLMLSSVGGGYSLDYSHYLFPFSLIIALSPLTTLLKLEIFFESKTNNLGEVCPLIIFLPSRHLVEHFLCLVWMQLEPLVNPVAILLVPLKD